MCNGVTDVSWYYYVVCIFDLLLVSTVVCELVLSKNSFFVT